MKSSILLVPLLSLFSIAQAGAVVLLGPSTGTVAANSLTSLGTVTSAQVVGYNQLVISYSVTTVAGPTGWFGLGINANTADAASSMTSASTNLGALLRTATGNTHQLFTGTNSAVVGTTPHDTSTTASVRLVINIPNGFTGNSAVSYTIDEGSGTFLNVDKTLTGTMTWTANQAVFTGAALSGGHTISNFTVEAIPEPGSAALALLSVSGLVLLRRKRA